MKLLAVSTTILFLLAGCGTPGAPQPPSLRLPKPVENLHATRVGDKVELAWTMPFETTDGDGIREQGTIEICRALPNPETLECRDLAGQLTLPITVTQTDREQAFTDDVAQFVNGPQDFFTYTVIARNARGRAAGTSNPVNIFLARSVPPVQQLHASVEPSAILLEWTAVSSAKDSRLRTEKRYMMLRKGPQGTETIAIPEGENSLRDTNFSWDTTYEYSVQGITRVLSRDGQTLLAEFAGEPSQSVTVTPHDVFPPARPEAVQAVYSAGAIDLTWRAVLETDIAGYNLYRSVGGAAPEKINAQPVVSPAYHDDALAGITAGTEITYIVTTVDLRGNESAKSEPAKELVPKQ